MTLRRSLTRLTGTDPQEKGDQRIVIFDTKPRLDRANWNGVGGGGRDRGSDGQALD